MENALEYIHSLNRFGIKPGLERITMLLELLGNPQKQLQCVHVAGTNGKGSVCSMLAEVLKAAGKKTGLFISPFVVCFEERIQINGEYISKKDLARLSKKMQPAAAVVANTLQDPVTEFEFVTALAFLWFAENNCDIVVLETGLGGRLDSTNVIESNLLSILTKINLDHTAVLGNTVAEIAGEKCGILKPNSAVISSNEQLPEAQSIIEMAAKQKQNRLIMANTEEMKDVEITPFGSNFCYKNLKVQLALPGRHQLFNAAQVIEAALYLKVPKAAILKGLRSVKFPCRLEQISKNPLLMIDGAHNPDGAETLAAYLAEFGLRPVAVCGMMQDKNCAEVLQKVAPYCQKIFTVTVQSNARSISAEQLAQLSSAYTVAAAAENYNSALQQAAALQQQTGVPLLIFGSLYLASDLRPLAQKLYG